ncbi:MAG TPA: MarR family transcriptional regulator [Ktedonobacteraceae bacterium]|jgi:DNA-binding MarR family transcriptional regulator|nr:MarR family transcriptional regulator [Ktedonobacteraceae bacterium]
MLQNSVQKKVDLAEALLDIAPKLLRRLRADIPLDEASEVDPEWRHVVELRATPGQLSLLQVLVEHKRCTMLEIAEYLAVAPSTATAMVKRLLAQGYIDRSHDNVNWRTVWVTPTELGRQAVAVFQQARLISLKSRLERLSEADRLSILAALPALQLLVAK